MPKVRLNEPFKELRGQIDGLIFRPMPDGTIWVSRAPDYSRRKPSPWQKAHNRRFQQAARYGCQAAREHPIYAELARGTVKTAYNMAVSDWFRPPVIHEVTQREGSLLVRATDNVLVTKVEVTVLDEHGEELEKGEATRAEGDWWEYFPRLTGKTITAAAWDLAGNTTKFDL
jgi:hypothetical protein